MLQVYPMKLRDRKCETAEGQSAEKLKLETEPNWSPVTYTVGHPSARDAFGQLYGGNAVYMDKTSSAGPSEAINLMYRWHQESGVVRRRNFRL